MFELIDKPEPENAADSGVQNEQVVSKRDCTHSNTMQYFGPVYRCLDCGKMRVKDICQGGWRAY